MLFAWKALLQDKEGHKYRSLDWHQYLPIHKWLFTAASPLQTWEGTVWETMCLGMGWMKFLVSAPHSQPLPFTKQPQGTGCDCSTRTTNQGLEGGIISSHGLAKLLMCGCPLTIWKTNGLVKGSGGSGKYCTLLCITKCRHNNAAHFFPKAWIPVFEQLYHIVTMLYWMTCFNVVASI